MKSIHAVKVKEHFMSFCIEYKSYRQFSFLFPTNFYQNLVIYLNLQLERERERERDGNNNKVSQLLVNIRKR